MNNWQTKGSKIVHTNPHFKIREDQIIRPDGKESQYFVIEQPNSVVIVPLTTNNEVYLIGLYRYATQMYSWEVPGGAVEHGDILGTAKKELQEETGVISNHWQKLGIYEAMNGCSNKISHVFLATEVVQTNENEQREEGISQMKKVPFTQVIQMIEKGEITDSHTITALTMAGLKLKLLKK